MSQDNQITLRGYVTAEPRFFQKTPASPPVAEIRVGSTPRRLNRETGEWQDAEPSYYTVKCWRRLAINAVSSLHKGDMVVVRGKFYMNVWVDNQQRPRATLEIEADTLGHDLSYGWSHFLRGSRPQSGTQAGVNAGEMARQDVGESSGGPAEPGADATRESGENENDEEYPADRDWPASADAVLGPDGQPDPAAPVTDSEGDRPGLPSDTGLREAEAVPF